MFDFTVEEALPWLLFGVVVYAVVMCMIGVYVYTSEQRSVRRQASSTTHGTEARTGPRNSRAMSDS